jgi:hypothetical protein
MSEESRYLAFADILHDIVGINHAEKHTAVIRLEDVTMNIYTPAQLNAASAALKAGNTPFALAFVPVYNDPLGYYNLGVPLTDRISDAADSTSVAFLASVKNAINSGAQLIIHGYTHQYSSVANPFDGTSGDDFEFWRETFATNNPASPYTVDIYAPVPEDSAAWVAGRIAAATNEMISAGLPWVGWESPHYSASAVDNAAFANSFPLTMARVLYFDDAGHVGGQFFPYEINHDVYGQHIIPENLGNFEPVIWNDYPARLAADLIRNARKNLVIRDGCANSYFHGFYDVTNLTTIVDGIKALGYTFVPVSTALPVILTQPASRTNALASAGSFSVTLTGPSPFTYQWRLNGANLAGGTNALLTLVNIQSANAGNYDVVVANQFGAVTSLVAVLTVTAPPVITTQPQSRTNATGSSATFSVVATSATPITYQWRFAGVNISGATNSSYTIASVTTANAGLYSVVVANANGSATSANARLTVGTPPTITTQPANRTNIVGANVTFSVVATGTATLRYQWYFNGAPIAGRTSTTLQLTSVQLTNTGNYSVLVTNAYGSVTSANGYLFVGTRPVVTTQPTSRTVTRGASTTFNVTATGTAPLSYQWRFRGVNISGATTSSYTIPVVATTNAGGYSVIIANPIGTVSSTSATLTVL